MWNAIKLYAATVLVATLVTKGVNSGTDIRVSQDPNPSQVENEPSITINKHFPGPDLLNVVACYNDMGNTLGASWSADSGKTWTDVQLPYVWSITGDPCVWSDNNGVVHAIFLSYEGTTFLGKSGIYYTQSIDGGRNWSSAIPVDNLVSSGSPVPFADKCMMAIDTFSTSPNVGNIYVGWQREPANTTYSDIFFARSTDGGASFSTPMQINDNPTGTAYCEGAFPFVGADGDVYMTWYDCYFQGHVPGSLYVDKSTDGGATFGTDTKVSNLLAPPKFTSGNTGFRAKVFPSAATHPTDAERLYITYISDPDGYFDRRLDVGNIPGTSPSDRPDVIRGGTWVFSAWQDWRNGGSADIYFNRSSDNGQTWELAAIGPIDNTVAPGSSNSQTPKLAYSSPYVYCVWEDMRGGAPEIYFNYSTNDGQMWKTEVNLSNAPVNISSWPTIAAVGSNVYVAWHDDRNGVPTDIMFVYSANNGVTWSAPQRIDLGDPAGSTNSFYPDLACSGSYVYCTWRDDRTGTTQPFFNYSANNGVSWNGVSQNLANGVGSSDFNMNGGLACTGSNVYACWTNDQGLGTYQTYFNRSTNNGVSWAGQTVINNHAPSVAQTMPTIALSGSYVYLGWVDNGLVRFDFSPNNGMTWQNPDIGPLNPGTANSGASWLDIDADANCAYALWNDGRVAPGFGEIWFNRSTSNGSSWSGETKLNLGTGPTPLLQFMIPVMAAGGGWVNAVWPDSRTQGGPMMPGMPNIYTNYSSDYGATWLSGLDEADVFCVRSTDGGATWGSPVTVNDDGTTYAQVLPWVAVKSNGYVDLTYYHFSPYQWHLGGQVRLAVSTDGAQSFLPTNAIQDLQIPAGTAWVGEYNGMAVLDDLLYTIFTDLTQTGSSDVFLDRTMNPSADGDGDGWPDGNDNCPTTFNPDQSDIDGDLIGDVCDPDADGDGVDSYAAGGTDCDDMNGSIFPGATETWYDGVDQNCDGWSDNDQDFDGFDADFSGGSDCNDINPLINPGETEVWYDGIDQDCDSWSDFDQDLDFFDSDLYGGSDCDDTNPNVNPGQAEICNGIDDDCDGGSDVEFGDSDADGWGEACDNCWAVSNSAQTDSDGDCPAMPYGSDPVCGDACASGGCCVGRVGDANNSGDDLPTIGDISTMIDAKFIAGTCVGKISCIAEADINVSATGDATCDDITIGDISMVIDYLFITGPESFGPLPDCP